MSSTTVPRVTATEAALGLVASLQREHGEILLHRSGGCCEWVQPLR